MSTTDLHQEKEAQTLCQCSHIRRHQLSLLDPRPMVQDKPRWQGRPISFLGSQGALLQHTEPIGARSPHRLLPVQRTGHLGIPHLRTLQARGPGLNARGPTAPSPSNRRISRLNGRGKLLSTFSPIFNYNGHWTSLNEQRLNFFLIAQRCITTTNGR